MINFLKERIPGLKDNWDKYEHFIKEIHVGSKTILLNEGETAQKMYFIKEGCLRLAFNNNGKDITFQFFFENQPVASMESFMTGQPSQFSLESVEPSTLYFIHKNDLAEIIKDYPEIKTKMQEIIIMRLSRYVKLFLSYIKDTPEQRYLELLKNEPLIIQRVPQHYVASYLGITPVSLSRIRKRINNQPQAR
jgi:CRP-like cAMP-binding protein